jgi:GNAT superfamily N-acetyltransferase
VHEQLRRTVRALAEVVEEAGPGWSARTPSLPLVHTLNRFHVPGRPGAAGEILALAEEVLALAEEHQADLGYRHVVVEDEGTARQLVASLGSAGWRVERLVLMALDARALTLRGGTASVGAAGEPVSGRVSEPVSGLVSEPVSGLVSDPVSDLVSDLVSELTADEAAELMRRWAVEDRLEVVPGVIEQLAVYNDREGRMWNERALGIRQDGVPVALTKYRSNDGVAWVEDVYTVPEARGRGYARTLVTRAAGAAVAAGHELTFIVADDEDWPKELYRDIGFRPVARSWTFHKDLGR